MSLGNVLDIKQKDQDKIEGSLRPKSLDEVIGRETEKKTISLMVGSAKMQNKSLDHMLFYGPPGLGKTSMANVIANLMGTRMHVTSGPAIEKQGDLASILSGLDDHSVLFIDEIHRMKRSIEEILYPAMEDGFIDIIIGGGTSAKSIRIDLPNFTLIGATTRLSMLSSPLRDRFGIHFHLDFYEDHEISQIVKQKASILGISINNNASDLIAKRSRRTARVAIRILKRAYDMAIVTNTDEINEDIVNELVGLLGIDENGLDTQNRKYIDLIVNNFANRPVGLSTIAAAMGEEEDTISTVIEPFLIREGYIQKTSKGRIATEKSIKSYHSTSISDNMF